MFYATNKLRHSAYLYTPSGSICPFCIFFSYPLKKGCKKLHVFYSPLNFSVTDTGV